MPQKGINFWPIEETLSGTFISVENCVFPGSVPHNRGHVKLVDAMQKGSTQQCQLQTQKTSHRTFDGEIQRMMTMPKNRDIV